MFRKFVKIIFINILVFLILYYFLYWFIKSHQDFISFERPNYNEKYETEEQNDNFIRYIPYNDENFRKFCGEERSVFGQQYKKNPIVVFGCSYAYGHGLKKKVTFSYILSEITKRPVYSTAGCGSDLIGSFEKLQLNMYNPNYADKVKKSDYIIYIYMWDHINRHLEYHKNKYNSKFDKFLNHFFVFDYLNKRLGRDRMQKNAILNIYKELKMNIPNAKFIIIIYDEKIPIKNGKNNIKYVSDAMNSKIWKEIEEETGGGIKVIHTKDLTGFVFDKDWKLKLDIADWHPNEKVWVYFTPLLVDKYIKD